MATANYDDAGLNLPDLDQPESYRIGFVVAEWNEEITQNLFQGGFDTLIDAGVIKENIVKWNVPGSFELVYGAKKMAESFDMLDAIVVIGNVIQGETKHFDFVCQGVTNGIQQLNVEGDIPVIFCVLTDNNIEQSKARSGGEKGNKGVEAAMAALKMGKLKRDAKFYKD
ncbi:MAG: 6,7-dimethyl-8-ribityllumazine synthase [Psychroflexus sp.]|nr:6,7-dimethyl-8-ribityllumazine synthase [Psychroflexus sp.]